MKRGQSENMTDQRNSQCLSLLLHHWMYNLEINFLKNHNR